MGNINRRNPRGPYNKADEPQEKINEQIRAREVRLVGDNVEQGIYSIQEARRIADEQELDLVEISPNAEPPVCKILDYQKYLYQKRKKAKEQKAKQTKIGGCGSWKKRLDWRQRELLLVLRWPMRFPEICP